MRRWLFALMLLVALTTRGLASAAPAQRVKKEPPSDGVLELGAQRAYYSAPTGRDRLGMKPVFVYLHARGGHPEQDCRRWARLTRPLGWLLCPSGPSEHNGGRSWDNNWVSASRITLAALHALRERFGRRVQLYGNTLIGFSEGAYAAMNIGVRDPRTFNRWLILAGTPSYWAQPGREALERARRRVHRVYLITGKRDEVVERSREVEAWLKRAKVTTRLTTPEDLGHELLLERKSGLYTRALRWLNQEDERSARKPAS